MMENCNKAGGIETEKSALMQKVRSRPWEQWKTTECSIGYRSTVKVTQGVEMG